jgi:hypothetical protein
MSSGSAQTPFLPKATLVCGSLVTTLTSFPHLS